MRVLARRAARAPCAAPPCAQACRYGTDRGPAPAAAARRTTALRAARTRCAPCGVLRRVGGPAGKGNARKVEGGGPLAKGDPCVRRVTGRAEDHKALGGGATAARMVEQLAPQKEGPQCCIRARAATVILIKASYDARGGPAPRARGGGKVPVSGPPGGGQTYRDRAEAGGAAGPRQNARLRLRTRPARVGHFPGRAVEALLPWRGVCPQRAPFFAPGGASAARVPRGEREEAIGMAGPASRQRGEAAAWVAAT